MIEMDNDEIYVQSEADSHNPKYAYEAADGPPLKAHNQPEEYEYHIKDGMVGKFFKMQAREATVQGEMIAGVIGFMTLSFVIPLNTSLLMSTGGPCPLRVEGQGIEYDECVEDVGKQLTTVTCLVAGIGSFLLGVVGKVPVLVAPSVAMTTYLAQTVISVDGSGLDWNAALTAVFMSGAISLAITITGIRGLIYRLFPKAVKSAAPGGIALLLALVGLQGPHGLGLITYSGDNLLELGGCPADDRESLPGTDNYFCQRSRLGDPVLWLGIGGFFIMAMGIIKRFPAAMLFGMLAVTVVGWVPNTEVSYFPDTDAGTARFEYFKDIFDFTPISMSLVDMQFSQLTNIDFWWVVATLLYTDMLGATGVLYTAAKQAGIADSKGGFASEKAAFFSHGVGSTIAGVLGAAPSSGMESMTALAAGGRTGFSAVIGASLLLLSIFLAPILTSIPSNATGPALILTGAVMCQHLVTIQWQKPLEAIPAFITILGILFTFSIAYGLIAGICASAVLHFLHYISEMAFGRMSFSAVKRHMRGQELEMQAGANREGARESYRAPAKKLEEKDDDDEYSDEASEEAIRAPKAF